MRSGQNGTARILVTAGSARNRDIGRRYAAGLYRQAFPAPGDSALAEHIVHDVIADESALDINVADRGSAEQ